MIYYGAATNDLEESIKLIESKKLNLHEMITHKLRLDEIQKGFQLVAEAKDSLKVVVYPQE